MDSKKTQYNSNTSAGNRKVQKLTQNPLNLHFHDQFGQQQKGHKKVTSLQGPFIHLDMANFNTNAPVLREQSWTTDDKQKYLPQENSVKNVKVIKKGGQIFEDLHSNVIEPQIQTFLEHTSQSRGQSKSKTAFEKLNPASIVVAPTKQEAIMLNVVVPTSAATQAQNLDKQKKIQSSLKTRKHVTENAVMVTGREHVKPQQISSKVAIHSSTLTKAQQELDSQVKKSQSQTALKMQIQQIASKFGFSNPHHLSKDKQTHNFSKPSSFAQQKNYFVTQNSRKSDTVKSESLTKKKFSVGSKKGKAGSLKDKSVPQAQKQTPQHRRVQSHEQVSSIIPPTEGNPIDSNPQIIPCKQKIVSQYMGHPALKKQATDQNSKSRSQSHVDSTSVREQVSVLSYTNSTSLTRQKQGSLQISNVPKPIVNNGQIPASLISPTSQYKTEGFVYNQSLKTTVAKKTTPKRQNSQSELVKKMTKRKIDNPLSNTPKKDIEPPVSQIKKASSAIQTIPRNTIQGSKFSTQQNNNVPMQNYSRPDSFNPEAHMESTPILLQQNQLIKGKSDLEILSKTSFQKSHKSLNHKGLSAFELAQQAQFEAKKQKSKQSFSQTPSQTIDGMRETCNDGTVSNEQNLITEDANLDPTEIDDNGILKDPSQFSRTSQQFTDLGVRKTVIKPSSHHKSISLGGQNPQIYNMFVGQAKQLKKSKITIKKSNFMSNTQANNIQINLNTEPLGVSATSGGVYNYSGTSESIPKSQIGSQGNLMKMQSQKVKSPFKQTSGLGDSNQQITRKSTTSPLQIQIQKSSQQDGKQILSVQDKTPKIIPKKSQGKACPQKFLTLDKIDMSDSNELYDETSSANLHVDFPSKLYHSLQPKPAVLVKRTTLTSDSKECSTNSRKSNIAAVESSKRLVIQNKPMPLSTKSSKLKTSEMSSKPSSKSQNLSVQKVHKSLVKAFSPKQQVSPANKNSTKHGQKQMMFAAGSETKTTMQGKNRMSLDSAAQQQKPQKAVIVQHSLTEKDDEIESFSEDDSKQQTNKKGKTVYVENTHNTFMSPETSSKTPQQISAAIINKIQNNYQFQVTNATGSQEETNSGKSLRKIAKKLSKQQVTLEFVDQFSHKLFRQIGLQNNWLQYLQAIQEIQDIYPRNQALSELLNKIHFGISSSLLTKEDLLSQTQNQLDQTRQQLESRLNQIREQEEHIQNLERNENETRIHVQSMTAQIDERDTKIDELEHKILQHQKRMRLLFKEQMQLTKPASMSSKTIGNGPPSLVTATGDQQKGGMKSNQLQIPLDLVFDGNCSELERQSEERHKVYVENEELQAVIEELNEDMAYGKQRENKLMFFLYILKQMGYPISEVFEREIKDVPTSRFSKNFDDEYKVMHEQLWRERKQAKREIKQIKACGFPISRDEVLVDFQSKSDRILPLVDKNQADLAIDGYSNTVSECDDGDGGEIGFDPMSFTDEIDLNFYPLQVGPLKIPVKPECIPYLDIDKVLIIKYRRMKGLSVADLCDCSDSNDSFSFSSDESLDTRGRPKRCPKPRTRKRILDSYGIQTGARNLFNLEQKVFKSKLNSIKKLLKLRKNQKGSQSLGSAAEIKHIIGSNMQAQVVIDGKFDVDLRYRLDSLNAEKLYNHRI